MKTFTSLLKKKKKSKDKQIQEKSTENNKISSKVIEQIKNFTYYKLTEEQSLLLEQLIPCKELRERYQKYGLCFECQQTNTGHDWCRLCNSKHFQQEFSNWTSGNEEIDKLIQQCQLTAIGRFNVLEWVNYEQFTNIEYLAEGGFGKVYKAYWENGYIVSWDIKGNKWKRSKYSKEIILKILNDSWNIAAEFLHEVTCYKLFSGEFNHVVKCYGISYNSQTDNYVMAMQYIPSGNLRQYLQNNYSKLEFRDKIVQLRTIIKGLNSIHQQGLIHRDFHPGNILSQVINDDVLCYITDLGLSRFVNEKDKKSVYGVLPYIAPEVLRGQDYTQASDIYSWSMIAYEILTGSPPYHRFAHDEFLAIQICEGLHPIFPIKIPLLLENLINKCWDTNPLRRPDSSELYETLNNWYEIWVGSFNKKNIEFAYQYQESEKFNKNNISIAQETEEVPSHQFHPQAIYTSRCLNSFTKNLIEPQNSKEINQVFYKISEELEGLRITDPVKFSEDLEKRFNNLQIEEKSSEILLESEEVVPIKTLEQPATLTNWTNIHPNFTKELTQQWQKLNFVYSQVQDWINISLQPADSHFAAYFRDIKHLTPEEVLNYHNLETLNQEFFNWWQQQQLQFQIEQSPK
ncbi:MAG: protein kinase [Candidatus Moeniiplasma glomeromycotorum]|nr:protein kinase [Candidatus Moeniiplasma glomeromycotorum]MCE8167298.1 protein kinase [Candidatus Moeniiplasma glomeromycotorum]MCE8168689.1 protein kinase [Candidatus Moeniiplasma glomeromycotorum]